MPRRLYTHCVFPTRTYYLYAIEAPAGDLRALDLDMRRAFTVIYYIVGPSAVFAMNTIIRFFLEDAV